MTLRFASAPPAGLAQGDVESAWAAQRARRFPASAAPALLAEGRATAGLEQLQSGGALAVTTGQQASLFTGPLYTVYKALSAAAFAEALAAQRRRPVVAVFWVAGDDHDFAEINHCSILGADGRPARITLRERASGEPMLPAYREAVGSEGASALETLEAALPPSEFRAETVAWLRRAYRADRSLAEASAVALAELLGPLGIVICRGWHPSLKAAARPTMLRALRAAALLGDALQAEAGQVREAGATPAVEVAPGMTLLMIEGRLGRDRLRLADGGRFVTRRSGETFTLDELEAIATAEPERLSASVLLRPAVEADLLPTVAYVAGPAELDYLAQAGPVFSTLGVPRPVRLPRLSGFLVEAKVDRVLGRYQMTPDALAFERELDAVVRDTLPVGAAEALAALRRALSERYEVLLAEAVAIERTLQKPVESARNQALATAQQIEKRLLAHLKRHDETALQQVSRAREQLFPDGRPQERVLSVVSFLARHGTAALELIFDAARAHARRLLEAPLPPT